MRVAPDVLAVEADQAHQLLDDTLALAGRADAVDGQRLGQNFTDGHARVQRGEGILENELNLLAELHQRIAAQRQHVDLLAGPFLVPRAGATGRAASRERECKYAAVSGVAVSSKKKNTTKKTHKN